MTLATNIYILGPVNVHDVLHEGRRLLGATDTHPWRDREERDGSRCLGNEIGTGLPSMWLIDYRPDGPLLAEPDGHDEYCEDDCDLEHGPACWCVVNLDTTYGYMDAQGRGCGDLHASLVAQLGQWLDERGVEWRWRNEFTGEIHGPGPDRYGRLVDLCSAGHDASGWFSTTVLPAICASLVDR